MYQERKKQSKKERKKAFHLHKEPIVCIKKERKKKEGKNPITFIKNPLGASREKEGKKPISFIKNLLGASVLPGAQEDFATPLDGDPVGTVTALLCRLMPTL